MNLPLAFGALVAGAVIVDYGVKSTKQAFASTGSSTVGGGAGSLAAGAKGKLNPSQQTFAARLQKDTGLDPKVIAGWILSEEPASAGQAPNGANNWLNIGAFDSGSWAFGGSSVWDTPETAADATASFIMGHPVGGVNAPAYGSGGIRAIIAAAGRGVKAQIAAIQRSGWASSGYPNLPSVVAGIG